MVREFPGRFPGISWDFPWNSLDSLELPLELCLEFPGIPWDFPGISLGFPGISLGFPWNSLECRCLVGRFSAGFRWLRQPVATPCAIALLSLERRLGSAGMMVPAERCGTVERYWNGAFWNGGNRNGSGTWNRVPAERYWNGGTVERWNRNGRSGSVGFRFQRCDYPNLAVSKHLKGHLKGTS